MAAPATTEASEIRRRGRQRLIGAVALVLLLVVFVPMVLDSEPRPDRTVPAIPPRENAPALPAPTVVPAPAKDVVPAKAGTQPTTAKVEPLEAKQLGSTPPKAPPAAPDPAKAAAQSPPKLEGFAVQVGAFRDEEKLAQARAKLTAAGITHYVERRASSSGDLNRLRAGPFPTREAAESALAKLKRASLDGKVVPLAAEREERKP